MKEEMGRKSILQIGSRNGFLVIQKIIGQGANRHVIAQCRCDCGKITQVQSHNIIKIKSCGCQRIISQIGTYRPIGKYFKLSAGRASLNYLFYQYKRSAHRKKLDFKLTIEQFEKLTSKKCFYCGSHANQSIGSNAKKYNGDYLHNGIDRVNNTRGYTKINCVSCCWMCNKAKNNLDVKIFVEWLKRISLKWTNDNSTTQL